MRKPIFLPFFAAFLALTALCACEKQPQPEETALALDKTSITLTVGATETLALSPKAAVPMSAAPQEPEPVEYVWHSSDESVATVSADGMSATVSALSVGKTTVTVAAGETILGTCLVTVEASPLSVTLYQDRLVLRKLAKATVKVKSSVPLSGEYIWESSDPSIGTVEYQNDIAIVTAVARGECSITVKNGTYIKSFTLIVGLK